MKKAPTAAAASKPAKPAKPAKSTSTAAAGGRVGGLYAFGWNGAGQLGTGDRDNKKAACLVESLQDKRVAMVACGGPYTVLSTDTDEVWGFGANTRGQLGIGDDKDKLEPCKLDPPKPLTSWQVELIACGYAHTVFLTEDLSVFSCGANSWGQLGLGDTDDRKRPQMVERLSRVAVRQLDCGAAHTVVVCDGSIGQRSRGRPMSGAKYASSAFKWDADEDFNDSDSPEEKPDEKPDSPRYPFGPGVYGFGRNKEGQLGLGQRASQTASLTDQIQKEPREVLALAPYLHMEGGLELKCGGYHTAVLVENRTGLLTFGQNIYGQLGLGDQTDRFAPQPVTLATKEDDPIDILACGGGHTMVVTQSKQVFAFGRNNRGQLGVGDMDHHFEPKLVKELCDKDIVQVECGSKHTIVLTKSNELYAIGRNTEGQLGLGEVDQQVKPARVDAEWLPSVGHLSVGGFSAHNFFVPVPEVRVRREQARVVIREQIYAFCMCLHRRLGKTATASMLSMDLAASICNMLPPRRTGVTLAEAEAIAARSPSIMARLGAPKPKPKPSAEAAK